MFEVASPRLPPPRILILLALWAAFALWMIFDIADVAGSDAPNPLVQYPSAAILFALDFWGLMAAVSLLVVAFNPLAWLNGKRLIVGSMALAMVFGRLSSVSIYAAGFPLSPPLPWTVILIAAPFVLLLVGVVAIFAIALLVGAVFTFFVGIPVVLFNQILDFDHAVTRYRYRARGLAGYIVRAVFWLRNEPMPDAPPDDSKGARFATGPEIMELYQPAPESMAFGHIGVPEDAAKADSPLFLKTDKHVLVMASTRSGKGVALIVPHLLRYRGSAFVLDPKAENARATGRQRARLNGKVHYLDPFGISGKPRSRFNPLARFTPDNMEAESKALAASLFVVDERKRDHWTASGQQLLAALILYVYASPHIPPEHKDLPTVRQHLLGGLGGTLQKMIALDDADGLLRDLAMSFAETPEKELSSIVSTARRQTEILDNPYMIACLSAQGDGPEVDFKDWHTGTMTVYLCLSAPKFPTFNRWLRLVLTSALDEMTDTLNPPPVPVCFMLDELATLGHLTTVENAVGLGAGYGIQLVTVFQDVAQMRDLYKGRWASFIGNAGVRALFNLDDFDSADYWSKFVGSRLVESYGRQENVYGLSQGQSVSEAMRPLLPPDQLMMQFSSDKMLVLAQGAHPIVSDRIPYWKDAGLDGLWDDPRTRSAEEATPPFPMPPGGPPRPPPVPPAPPRPNGPAPSPVEAPVATRQTERLAAPAAPISSLEPETPWLSDGITDGTSRTVEPPPKAPAVPAARHMWGSMFGQGQVGTVSNDEPPAAPAEDGLSGVDGRESLIHIKAIEAVRNQLARHDAANGWIKPKSGKLPDDTKRS